MIEDIISISTIQKYTYRIYKNDIEISRGSILIDNKPVGKPAGLVEDIWTHPDYRKHGYATQVMYKLIGIAKAKGSYKVVLSCANHNIAFYEKLGFKIHENGMRLNLYED